MNVSIQSAYLCFCFVDHSTHICFILKIFIVSEWCDVLHFKFFKGICPIWKRNFRSPKHSPEIPKSAFFSHRNIAALSVILISEWRHQFSWYSPFPAEKITCLEQTNLRRRRAGRVIAPLARESLGQSQFWFRYFFWAHHPPWLYFIAFFLFQSKRDFIY